MLVVTALTNLEEKKLGFFTTGRQTSSLALKSIMVATLMSFSSFAQAHESLGPVEIAGGTAYGVPSDVHGVTVFRGLRNSGYQGGEHRFGAPTPIEPWYGPKTFDQDPPQAMQPLPDNDLGRVYTREFRWDPLSRPEISENGSGGMLVYTPAKSADEKLPVYVFIHGGANECCNAAADEFKAGKLAEQGIVVVFLQYRLGLFGGLALPELQAEHPQGIAGNQRQEDLVHGLKWVRDNIAGFGGDPEMVTIGGHSAGGLNTYNLLRNESARGLFKRAILLSTYKFDPLRITTPEKAFEHNQAAINAAFGKEMTLADLRALDASEFFKPVAAEDDDTTIFMKLSNFLSGELYGSTLDGVIYTEESVDDMRPGALDGIDIMVGATANELTPYGPGPGGKMPIEAYEGYMSKAYGERGVEAYPAETEEEAMNMRMQARGDEVFTHRARWWTEYVAKKNDVNAYFYYFDNPPPGREEDHYGSYHAADLWYMFNSMRMAPGQRDWTRKDFALADTMTTYIANFVKSGDPNGDGMTAWPKAETGEFMHFVDGEAKAVANTPFPLRDELNKKLIFDSWGIDPSVLDN